LLGFDFAVEYKLGTANVVADALSHRDTEEEGLLLSISSPHFDFISRLRLVHNTNPALVALREEITGGARGATWSLVDGMVQFGGRLYIPPASPLAQEIMAAIHEDGHEGVQHTLHQPASRFSHP
jgi:hypothetical protein